MFQARYSHSEHHFKGAVEGSRALEGAVRGLDTEAAREAVPSLASRRENSMLFWSQAEVN